MKKKVPRSKIPQYGHRHIVCGVGFFDAKYSKTKDELTRKAYRAWNNMLQRCYGKSSFPSKNSYHDCIVCNDWYSFLSFRRWFDENYVEGYQLDKDILVKGNKVYSPETCSYVPPFINTLLLSCGRSRGEFPLGVSMHKSGYASYLFKRGKNII